MRRTILGLLALALPLIGAPMGVKAEEVTAAAPQSPASTAIGHTSTGRQSIRQDSADLRRMIADSQARQRGEHLSEPLSQEPQAPPGRPPVIPVVPAPVAPAPVAEPTGSAPVVALVVSPTPASRLGGAITLADIRQERPDALPQQKAGEPWKPVRIQTEVRSRPRDTTFDVKAEVVTKGGIMSGVQYVTQLGSFTGENLKEIWKGSYTDSRLEFWAGIHGRSQDARTRWSLVGFGRQLTHTDSGSGQSRPGTEYPYSYKWSNQPKPITQLGGRARIERDLIQDKSQQLTIHVKGEAAATVSGQSDWAYDVQAGVWYRTAQIEAYGEVGMNNTGTYANGYGRYYLTSTGQLKPFVEVRGEVGDGYHNVQVGGGAQLRIGQNGYTEAVLGYNTGTSGDGLAATVRAGLRF